MPYFYIGNCTDLPGEDIGEMVDTSHAIGYAAFVRNFGIDLLRETFPDYNWERAPGGLRLRDDYAVSYGKGVFQETPVYFVTHSSIEYVFEERYR